WAARGRVPCGTDADAVSAEGRSLALAAFAVVSVDTARTIGRRLVNNVVRLAMKLKLTQSHAVKVVGARSRRNVDRPPAGQPYAADARDCRREPAHTGLRPLATDRSVRHRCAPRRLRLLPRAKS